MEICLPTLVLDNLMAFQKLSAERSGLKIYNYRFKLAAYLDMCPWIHFLISISLITYVHKEDQIRKYE